MEFNKLLDELGINSQEVLERFCGNENLLQRLIFKFPEEKTFSELEKAYEEGDYFNAEKAVHTLKGIAANFGFEALFKFSIIMLDDLRDEKTNLPNEFEDVKNEYNRLISHINAYIKHENNR